MRKYKVTVEAELTLNDFVDHIDVNKFSESSIIIHLINEENNPEECEYKLSLELWDNSYGEFIQEAIIKAINVSEITN